MLKDPLKIPYLATDTDQVGYAGTIIDSTFNLVDPGAQVGKTVRVGEIGGLPSSLVISHSETKENKPYGTKRVTVRFETTVPDSLGNFVTGFAQVTVGFPKAVFTPAMLDALRAHLASFILIGETPEEYPVSRMDGDAFWLRLLKGEG